MMLRIGAAVLVGAKLLLDRYYSVKMLFSMMIVGLLLLTAYLNSGYSHVFYLLMICLGIRYVDSRKMIAFDFWMRVILCGIIVLCGITGVIENYVTYRTNSDVLRYSISAFFGNTEYIKICGILSISILLNTANIVPNAELMKTWQNSVCTGHYIHLCR